MYLPVSVLLIFFLVFPAWAANNHDLPTSSQEQAAIRADTQGPYLATGCTPAVSADLTIAPFDCQGYVLDGKELVYVERTLQGFTIFK